MLGPLIVNFDHATRDGVVEGSLAVSDLDEVEVSVGATIGVMDSGAGPYEAEVIEANGDRIRARSPALSVPRSRPGLADAEDIERWAGAHRARTELPKLVRRLLADTPGVTDLSIRAGRGVDFSGWDGRVDGGSGTAYVPVGLSCWEMSTSRDPKRQAHANYRKRTEDPKGVDPTETTFVFLTPRRWPEKGTWEQAKRADGTWWNVRVLDADDLAGWLESRYGVHVWFSELLGLRPGDVETLAGWWSRWSAATDPPIPEALLIAGRSDEARQLQAELDGNPSVTGIRAGSRGEATAFVAVALDTSEDTDQLGRSFVVTSATAWDHSVSTHGRSVLIPTFDGADVRAALSAGHHVAVPMGVEDRGQAIDLPRIERSEARAAFEDVGIDQDRADRYAVRARRSLTSLWRGLSLDPRTARPGWAQGSDGDMLGVPVLVGAWSDNRDTDRKMVSEIVNSDYKLVERLLRKWEHTADPPFRRSGGFWRLCNPEDAWTLLSHRVIRDDLERWRNAVLQVLGTRDSYLDLDTQGRFMASVRGDEQRWSFDLRLGLAQGVAMLAALDIPQPVGGRTGPDHAESLVRDLLGQAGEDNTGKLWQQLSDVLPLLAEAAPDVFLKAVQRDTAGETPVLRKMFTDTLERGTPWNEASAHTGLLWALETVSWSSDYLPEALEVLVRLVEIDPGGRLANRPIDIAANVLLPWRPQTGVPLDRRLRVLGGLLQRHESVGQDLSFALLSRDSVSLSAAKPRFRDWVPDLSQVTTDEFLQAVWEIARRALAVVKHDPHRLVTWIDELPHLYPEVQKMVIDLLQKVDTGDLSENDRRVLWEALDRLSEYSDRDILQKWMVDGFVQALDDLLIRLRPDDAGIQPSVETAEKVRLFGWDPACKDARQEAIRSLYDSGSLSALLDLTERAENTGLVGITAADVLKDSELFALLQLLNTSNCNPELAMSWIRHQADNKGTPWIKKMVGSVECLQDEVRALFFRSLSPGSDVWKLVDRQERAVREMYWGSVNDFSVSSGDISTYISYLLDYNRPWLAVRTVTYGLKMGDNPSVSTEQVEDILIRLIEKRSKQVLSTTHIFHVGKLLDYLTREKPDSTVLIAAELALFKSLTRAGYSPRAVYQGLEADPCLFVDLVCFINSNSNVGEEIATVSQNVAWAVVHQGKFLPGREVGTSRINYEKLQDWVVKSRRLFSEREIAELGDQYLGELLARSPVGIDDVWPTEEVRRLLEKAGTEQMGKGMVTGAFNRRGVVVRDPLEGGRQERDLARQYSAWATKVDAEYPSSGRVLRQLAKLYLHQADLEDEQAERLGDLD